jgi:hypothetical protein
MTEELFCNPTKAISLEISVLPRCGAGNAWKENTVERLPSRLYSRSALRMAPPCMLQNCDGYP